MFGDLRAAFSVYHTHIWSDDDIRHSGIFSRIAIAKIGESLPGDDILDLKIVPVAIEIVDSGRDIFMVLEKDKCNVIGLVRIQCRTLTVEMDLRRCSYCLKSNLDLCRICDRLRGNLLILCRIDRSLTMLGSDYNESTIIDTLGLELVHDFAKRAIDKVDGPEEIRREWVAIAG